MTGVDLSHHNAVTDYARLRNSVDFAYIKATEGTGFNDPSTQAHWTGMAGKPRGLYHYTDLANIVQEVKHFVGRWRSFATELHPALDAECKGINSVYIRDWRDEFRQQTQHEGLVVYSGKALFEGACNPAGFVDAWVWLWAARYFANDQQAAWRNLGWDHPRLVINQYWNKGTVPGLPAGTVDVNVARSIPFVTAQEEDVALTAEDTAAIAKAVVGTEEFRALAGRVLGAVAGRNISEWLGGPVGGEENVLGRTVGARLPSIGDKVDEAVTALADLKSAAGSGATVDVSAAIAEIEQTLSSIKVTFGS